MKNCPFCKAQIEDNARFCLYCMKPLTEKETIPPQKKDMRWLFVVAGAVLAVAIILLLPDRKPAKPQKPSADIGDATVSTTTQTETPTADPMQESTGESVAEPTDDTISTDSTESTVISATEMSAESTGAAGTKPGGTKPATKGTEGTRAPATTPIAPGTKATTGPVSTATTGPVTLPVGAPTTKPATKTTTTPTSEPTTKPTTNPTTAPTTKSTTVPTTPPPATGDVSKLPQYTWEHPYTSSTFKYRAAVQADVLGLDYSVTGNDIVITRIELDDHGWLQIPSYIEGKRVIALDSATFIEGIAEVLYLPKTLLALQDNIFKNETPRYLYVSGEVLAMGENAEPNVEIYTTKTCVNQHGEKFSNLSYWQEWSAQTYAYRTALPSDVGDSGYKNTAGDIVIINVDMPNEDYIYDIPAYIDGKKVVAIGPWALSNTCAVAIYVPATVKCVGMGAFNYCMYGANIYFRGESVYAASNPFDYDSAVTLRCSATCRNGSLGYYKDLAKGYGVTWKKWNG